MLQWRGQSEPVCDFWSFDALAERGAVWGLWWGSWWRIQSHQPRVRHPHQRLLRPRIITHLQVGGRICFTWDVFFYVSIGEPFFEWWTKRSVNNSVKDLCTDGFSNVAFLKALKVFNIKTLFYFYLKEDYGCFNFIIKNTG